MTKESFSTSSKFYVMINLKKNNYNLIFKNGQTSPFGFSSVKLKFYLPSGGRLSVTSLRSIPWGIGTWGTASNSSDSAPERATIPEKRAWKLF